MGFCYIEQIFNLKYYKNEFNKMIFTFLNDILLFTFDNYVLVSMVLSLVAQTLTETGNAVMGAQCNVIHLE